MQLVHSATLSRLYGVLGDFHISTDILVQYFFLLPDFHPCSIGTKRAYDITLTEWSMLPSSRNHCM